MKNKDEAVEVQGTKTAAEKESRYQFTLKEINQMVNEPKLVEIVESLSKDEMNTGKAGSYLLAMAKAISKQLSLI